MSDWCQKIVGIDIEPEMIAEAKRLHQQIRIGSIDWFNGTPEQYKEQFDEPFHLVTIAKAFHWMDRPKVLDDLYEMIEENGGVTIIDNYDPQKKQEDWQLQLNEVIEMWYGKERRAGNSTYSHPTTSHEEIVAESKFHLENYTLPPYEITWTVESIIGNLYSTSYGSKRFLGSHVKAFEDEVTDALLSINGEGLFKEQVQLSMKLALK
ncbi:class I SAM-dependent methyltransferase [Bacillus carboniphilus]|uniref:Class I SAM-dependent methyltransferase n=1 Tax=Bacillus carboniphilus TaxID=86663 RepID=A0ABY9JRQ7_9BACI|nr:class I SAM-dependent methyltransferase [Bacillus carboniphilus]WLR42094.1 class I SAM-dependent methyltransferase [Bacillus carboniphilus]